MIKTGVSIDGPMAGEQHRDARFVAGDIDGAITAAVELLRANPSNVATRYYLAELLCFRGEWERADKQLDVLSSLDAKAAIPAAQFRQVIRAEMLRQAFHKEGKCLPETIGSPSPELTARMKLAVALRSSEAVTSDMLLPEHAGSSTGQLLVNGKLAREFRDLDDVTAGVLEVLTTSGRFFWIPFEAIVSASFQTPTSVRDLIFRPVEVSIRGGPDGIVYVPTLYPGDDGAKDWQIMLGRATTWNDLETAGASIVTGNGLRMFLLDDADVSILEMISIEKSN